MVETVSEATLKNCPFCGAPMEQHPRFPNEWRHAFHHAPRCPAALAVVYMTDPEAIAAWNRRSTPDVGELCEALTKAAEQFEFYEREHYSKMRAADFNGLKASAEASREKALTNAQFAVMCRALLARHSPPPVKP
jgi:hypothetical protein